MGVSIIPIPGIRFQDTDGVSQQFKHVGNKIRVSPMPYLYDIAENNLASHYIFLKTGSNASVGTTEEIISPQGGILTHLSTAEQLQIVSSDVDDQGLLVDSGTATGGSATTLIDSGGGFTAAATVGDLIINDTDCSVAIILTKTSDTILTVYKFTEGTDNAFESGDAYRIVNANDTGAAVVGILGLDSDWNPQCEFIILNGQTDVTTVGSYLRINDFTVRLAGSSEANEGNIDIENNASALIISRILTGTNHAMAGFWTVPDGHTLYITSGDASDESKSGTTMRLYVRKYTHVFKLQYKLKLNSNAQQINLPPFKVEERSDIELRALSVLAGGDICASLFGWYEANI